MCSKHEEVHTWARILFFFPSLVQDFQVLYYLIVRMPCSKYSVMYYCRGLIRVKEFFSQLVLYCWQLKSSSVTNGGEVPLRIKKFFHSFQLLKSPQSMISWSQIPLLPLSYLKAIVQVHNGCLRAFSLLPILNSRSPALSLQYVQCKWQQSEWWWVFETGGGAGCHKPSRSVS